MIAPLKSSHSAGSERSRGLREAHRWVASTFLPDRSSSKDRAPRVAPWKAWVFAVWVVVVTVVYFMNLLGLFG
jgi:hypothetical protein